MSFMPGAYRANWSLPVGLAGAGGEDQGVVRRDRGTAQAVGGDRLGGDVDVGDVAQDRRDVALLAHDLAGGRSDLALGEDAGRDLVQQRLEEVARRAGDQGDLDVRAFERAGREQPAEPGSDDDDAVPRRGAVGGVLVRGMALTSSATGVAYRSFRQRMRPRHP